MTTKDKTPEEYALDAAKASEAGKHVEAERMYLLAAARAAAQQNNTKRQESAKLWDRCAVRERRLAELAKRAEAELPSKTES